MKGGGEIEQRFVVSPSVLTTLYGRQIEDCLDDRLKMPPLSQAVAGPSVKDSCKQTAVIRTWPPIDGSP